MCACGVNAECACARELPAGWRDANFEREFLDGAERRAKSMGVGFTQKVRDRLERAERQYGVASYLDKGLRGCLSETDEEGLDLGGWGVLAALIANEEVGDHDTRCYVVDRLQHIAALGVEVHQVVQELQRLLD